METNQSKESQLHLVEESHLVAKWLSEPYRELQQAILSKTVCTDDTTKNIASTSISKGTVTHLNSELKQIKPSKS